MEHFQLVLVGNTGETQGSMIFVVENNPAKMRHFLDGIKSPKSRGVSDWMVCGVELRDVDS